MNKSATPAKLTSPRRPLSVWELPRLLEPVHRHRKTPKTPVRERPHFRAILAFIHRNRFGVASQIQRRFSKYLPSNRTTRRHLVELETLGYLDVVDTNNVGPLWPKVYFVTRRGLTCLKSALREQGQEWSESRQDRRRSEGSSAPHVLHELFITEFLLLAWESAQARDDLQLLTTQRRSLAKHEAFKTVVAGRPTRLQPDGMFVCRQAGRGMMCCFIEVDLDTMSLTQMEAKFRRYQHWAESSVGSEYLKGLYQHHGATAAAASFRMLLIVGSRTCHAEERRLTRLMELAEKCPSNIRERIWFTTVGRLRTTAKKGDLLTEPIWLRPRTGASTDGEVRLPLLRQFCDAVCSDSSSSLT